MGAMTHAAGRMAFSAAIDVALKDVRKNREEACRSDGEIHER